MRKIYLVANVLALSKVDAMHTRQCLSKYIIAKNDTATISISLCFYEIQIERTIEYDDILTPIAPPSSQKTPFHFRPQCRQ